MIDHRRCPRWAPAACQRAFSWLAFAAVVIGGCNAVFGIHEGTPRPICADTDPSEPLIDDMEDGEGTICPLSGRNGHWYTYGDGTTGSVLIPNGSLDPTRIVGNRGNSQFAAHFTGDGFTEWGALMGFNLQAQGVGTQPVDVHTVTGLRFWMKSNVPVQVSFRTPETIWPKDGGQCTDGPTTHNCNNDFAFPITMPGGDWAQYDVPKAALRQLQPGGTANLNLRFLDSIQFNVGPGAPFDVWVDDIRFYYCTATLCLPTCTHDRPVACPATARDPASCQAPGTDCAAMATWCADPAVIDDMEDADDTICPSGGRQGGWGTNGYMTGDPSPEKNLNFEPALIPGGRGASRYAARMAGTGITGLSRMGFGLNSSATGEADYDGSKFDGIRFWLRSDVPIIVGFTSPETLPVSQNGTCDESPAQENCHHHFEFRPGATGGEWLDYEVPFSALKQAADQDAPVNAVPPNATWSASRLRSIAFLTSASAFDVWVDDIAFYTCGAAPCLPTCTGDTPVSCAASSGRPAGCWPVGTNCASLPALVP